MQQAHRNWPESSDEMLSRVFKIPVSIIGPISFNCSILAYNDGGGVTIMDPADIVSMNLYKR